MNKLEFITTGNELMTGLTADANFSWAAGIFSSNGVMTSYHCTVGDDAADITAALKNAAARSRFILVTGGLGPTEDDLSSEVSAKFFGVDLYFDQDSYSELDEKLKKRGRAALDIHRKQAMFPSGAEIIKNNIGTSNGFKYVFNERNFYFLPGVPGEFKSMLLDFVLPDILGSRETESFLVQKVIKTIGLGESEVALKLKDLDMKNVVLSYRVKYPEVHLKLVVSSNSSDEGNGILDKYTDSIINIIGEFVFTAEDKNLEEVVADLLFKNNLTISTAESCTGGLLGNLLTDIPGSSEYIKSGLITYSNEAKTDLLGVDEELFETVGAVSSEVAEQMASGVRKKSASDIGVGISGIAGPGGGTEDKPVGTVWIGVDYMDKIYSFKYNFHGDRKDIKMASAKYALDNVRKLIKNI